jgi:hypothetical protein
MYNIKIACQCISTQNTSRVWYVLQLSPLNLFKNSLFLTHFLGIWFAAYFVYNCQFRSTRILSWDGDSVLTWFQQMFMVSCFHYSIPSTFLCSCLTALSFTCLYFLLLLFKDGHKVMEKFMAELFLCLHRWFI